ncbi:hypothetical protein SADUNF_Sadunf17G0019000 [Salix dunnii]|uniref:Uncharacterized protein n=1 Tax=Salix dunnii TaxID=1413687 RepID=A0A835J535_9ROSI|nr:hypothetical protein SADUNF_Sadunf17G0019000 [Salix dunnii]
MQGQPLLDDDLSTWVDSMTGGEILPMPDAPETGLGTEPADQPFEMDMSNISSSLMQSVAERESSSKRPVDRSVPSSSNNEATNAASTPVRGLASEQEEQPRLDDGLGGMDILIGGETELVEEPRAPVVLMTDEPETRQRTEQAHQSFQANTKSISSSSMMDDVLRMLEILHLDGLMILETLFEAPSDQFALPDFCYLKEIREIRFCCIKFTHLFQDSFHCTHYVYVIYCDYLLSACSGYGTVHLLKLDRFSWG